MPEEERPEERPGAGDAGKFPEASFLSFISGLAAQTLMQLGEIENPFEKKKVLNLQAARYSIDLLSMLQEKTEGNLGEDEKRYLGSVLHDLRLRFVTRTRTTPSPN